MNNRLGNGQAQARAVRVQLLARLVRPKEAVEQAGDHLSIDGRSGVDDIHGGSVQVPLNVHDHLLARWGVANGVGQEVAERPAQHQPVANDLRRPDQLQSDLLFFGKGLVEVKQSLCFVMDRNSLRAGKNEPVVSLGQEQHVSHHAGQALVLLGVGGQYVLVLLGRTSLAERDLRLCHQIVDRRTQLVSQVRRKLGQAVELLLQAPEHLVEGGRQVGHLHRKLLGWHPLVQSLCRDGHGAGPHGAKGGQAILCGPPAQDPSHQRCQCHVAHKYPNQFVHEVLVVSNVHGHPDLQRRLCGIRQRHGFGHSPVLTVLDSPRGDPQAGMLGPHAQVRRKLKVFRRVQRLTIAKHGDEEALMAVQNVIQPRLQILRRLRFADDLTRQVNLVTQCIAVKLHEMPVNGNRHESSQSN